MRLVARIGFVSSMYPASATLSRSSMTSLRSAEESA
jgi:hypothetical protein